MRYSRGFWIGAAVGVLALTACGGDSRECGAGTVEMDGVCVPEDMMMETVECGEGTTLMDMTCVPADEPISCAEGTTRMGNECVPDIADCAPGTTAMGDQCVPDGSVICADGTIFDAETGTCVLGEVCGEGTTLIDGECIPNDETLMGENFAAAEPDDPSFGGTPGSFGPPAVGEETTIDGCITPADFDDDGVTDPDLDFFTFSAAGPTLLRINADGLGGASAAFMVFAVDGPLADFGWHRAGMNLTGDTSERRVYLPQAGNYALLVFDSRSVGLAILNLELFEPIQSVGFQPVGDADTCYFITVESEAVPTPTETTELTLSGQLGDPQFYSVPVTGDSVYFAEANDMVRGLGEEDASFGGQVGFVLSSSTETTASFGLQDAEGNLSGQHVAISPEVPDGESLLVVVDAVFNIAHDPIDWTLSLDRVPEAAEDGSDTTLTKNSDDPLAQLMYFNADANDVVHFSFVSDGNPLALIIRGPGLAVIDIPCGVTAVGGLARCVASDSYFVPAESGRHIVQVISQFDAEGADYTLSTTIHHQTPAEISAGSPMPVTLEDERTFVRVDMGSHIWTRFTLSDFMGTGFTAANIGIHPDQPGPLADPAPDVANDVTDWFGRIWGTEFGNRALLEITDASGTFDEDEAVTLGYTEETFTHIMIDPETPAMREGDAIAAETGAYYFVEGVPAGELTFTVTPPMDSGVDVSIELLRPDVSVAETINEAAASEAESFVRLIPLEGWFAFRVDAGATETMVDVDVSQTYPPYTPSVGSTTFVDVCPSGGGSGSLVEPDAYYSGYPAADEGLYSASVSTFTGFEFFGVEVSGFTISTNGWLTFDATYSSNPQDFNADLADPAIPNSLVAPLWRDLVSERVCVLEEAGSLIVQWNGTGLAFTGTAAAPEYTPFGTVQMQAIFNADGTLEFVYGPLHDVSRAGEDGVLATVGLENEDGSIGIPTSIPVAGDTSILFTPPPAAP